MTQTDPPTISPPEADVALALEPPKPVAAVTGDAAVEMVKTDPADIERLDRLVAGYMDAVTTLDVRGTEFRSRVNDINNLGSDEIRASAGVSSRFLDRPMASLSRGPLSQGSEVSESLLKLRRTVEDLDPSTQGDLFSPRRLLGLIPFGDKIRDYFARYQSSQTQLNAIIEALYHGQDELRKDNAAIEQEKANLWEIMGRLRQYAYLGQRLDAALSERIGQLEATDAERARVLREDLLFAVRQKTQDILTQLAVSVQGYLALDLVRKNNLELVKGVDRATTTTVSALRTAVIVAQALINQKLVLDQIRALNTTTSNMIEATSVMLRTQSAETYEQAASATLQIEKLQAAFTNVYAAIDAVSEYRTTALSAMQQTIEVLQAEVSRSQGYLDRVRKAEATEALEGAELELEAEPRAAASAPADGGSLDIDAEGGAPRRP
jgi:uncharacterized protein YaaN involved in tellurite resistance